MRMLMNNLDPEVAEDPDRLIVYGGTGRAARNWEAFRRDRSFSERARKRRDPARPIWQAGRQFPHARRSAASADREFQSGGPLVELRESSIDSNGSA